LVIHPRDRELIVGTHGRSLYVLDLAPLEEATPKVLASAAHLFAVKPVTAFKVKEPEKADGPTFAAPNPSYGAVIYYYLKSGQPPPVSLAVTDAGGKPVVEMTGAKDAGLHRLVWNLRPAGENAAPVEPGEYTVTLKVGGKVLQTKVR